MLELIPFVEGLGITGFAFFIFLMYRKDRKASEKQIRDDRIFAENRLTGVLDDDLKTREENTKALTELVTLLKRMNGKS